MESKHWLMAQVARMYYIEQLTQEDIARKMHFSRSTVSRLLDEARRAGIIQVQIRYPWQQDARLEYALCKRYNLHDARVLVTEGLNREEIRQGIGAIGARCLNQLLTNGITLALSTGELIAHLVDAFEPRPDLNCNVAQMLGNHGGEQGRRLGGRLGGSWHLIPAALVQPDEGGLAVAGSNPGVVQVLEQASRAPIGIVQIGTVTPTDCDLIYTNQLKPEELHDLAADGAVGELAGSPYNREGQAVHNQISKRIISLGIDRIKRIPLVIGLVEGEEKLPAVLGALKGNLLDVLVTNTAIAQAILAEDLPA